MALRTDNQTRNGQINIRKAEPSDLDVMKKVMARAYEEEPYTLHVVLQDERRMERAEKMIEIVLKYYVIKYEHVFVPEQVNAVAMWYPPEPQNSWKSSKLRDFSLMHKAISVTGVRKVPSSLSGGSFEENEDVNFAFSWGLVYLKGVAQDSLRYPRE